MAAASDKARFFLEQSVPELKEFERKKIFTSEEISKIARQRSDFEHKINARGSTASDYVRYAEFETNVDALRKKRMKRLGVKSTTHNGQRRIFFVYDRGTKKHPADVGLWVQAIEYAKRQKANKKLQQMFTNVLRLHPTRPELWIYAAQFAMEENGDVTEARGYMQRGLRFNKNKRTLWLQYLRLEMSYIAKIQARREILGIAGTEESNNIASRVDDSTSPPLLISSDVVPETAGDGINSRALKTLEETPTQSGAIPVAILDAAHEQFKGNMVLFEEILSVLESYTHLAATKTILQHIKRILQETNGCWVLQACDVWLPVVGISPTSAEFPPAFRLALKHLREYQKDSKESTALAAWARRWLNQLQEVEDLDPALRAVASSVGSSL